MTLAVRHDAREHYERLDSTTRETSHNSVVAAVVNRPKTNVEETYLRVGRSSLALLAVGGRRLRLGGRGRALLGVPRGGDGCRQAEPVLVEVEVLREAPPALGCAAGAWLRLRFSVTSALVPETTTHQRCPVVLDAWLLEPLAAASTKVTTWSAEELPEDAPAWLGDASATDAATRGAAFARRLAKHLHLDEEGLSLPAAVANVYYLHLQIYVTRVDLVVNIVSLVFIGLELLLALLTIITFAKSPSRASS